MHEIYIENGWRYTRSCNSIHVRVHVYCIIILKYHMRACRMRDLIGLSVPRLGMILKNSINLVTIKPPTTGWNTYQFTRSSTIVDTIVLLVQTPKKLSRMKKDQVGMDALRITETNLMGILHGCHYKTHTHTWQFSMYNYTIHIYVLYGPCLLSN